MRIGVIIASLGRPENVAVLLTRLANQSVMPAQVILSMESAADAPPDRDWPFAVEKIFGPRGSSVQRNRGLDRMAPDIDVVIFYDDDFVPSRFALSGLAQFFAANPGIAGADGLVLADGATGPGISPEAAQQIADAADAAADNKAGKVLRQKHGLYGCNMAYRTAAIAGIRFDENLPLYAWFEDLDFGGRITGPLVSTDAFRGVHCGEKRGRERNGRRLGYSQIANPLYLVRKGTLPRSLAIKFILRQFLANHAKSIWPEPWIDRKGRVAGNWLAVRDIILGRADPRRILDL